MCTIAVTILRLDSPTSAGGWGQVTYQLSGTTDPYQAGTVLDKTTGYALNTMLPSGDGTYTVAIRPEGIGIPCYLIINEDQGAFSTGMTSGCFAQVEFTIPAYAEPVDPSLADVPRWQPVGGVLPSPIPLAIEASLTDAAGLPRPGLYAEVELWRPGALVAFATFRASVRQASQTVDAAPYLRAELRAVQTYALGFAPLLDEAAALRFTYRYRLGDRQGVEPWRTRAGERYAVLAALPEATDTMQPYVADTTGRVASVFPDFEGVQFVGLPLEASVLLPPATAGQPRFVEFRYLDAGRHEVEIRALPLAATLPAGMLRLPLPADPPLCAAFVEVALVDTDRAYLGTCGHVTPGTVSGTYADPLYGFY